MNPDLDGQSMMLTQAVREAPLGPHVSGRGEAAVAGDISEINPLTLAHGPV